MGAVFTIFLLVPLFIPVFIVNLIIENVTGIPSEEQFELLSQALEKWAVENPETVAAIGDSMVKAFDAIKEFAEIADSILIS